MIPSELTGALRLLSSAFSGQDKEEPLGVVVPRSPDLVKRADGATGVTAEAAPPPVSGGVDFGRTLPRQDSGADR